MRIRKMPKGPCEACGSTDRYPTGICRPCAQRRSRDAYRANPVKGAARRRAYRAANLEMVRTREREWGKTEVGRKLKRERLQSWAARNPQKRKEHQVRFKRKLRQQAFDHYGRECACCGETQEEFLTIDHIAGNGSQHRRLIGSDIYQWLRTWDYPPGFRILCFNCNCALGFRGYCPHGNVKIELFQDTGTA